MLSILNQLKTNFVRILFSPKHVITEGNVAKHIQDTPVVDFEELANLKLQNKCQKALEELRHVKNFTHWPVTQLKTDQNTAQSHQVRDLKKHV